MSVVASPRRAGARAAAIARAARAALALAFAGGAGLAVPGSVAAQTVSAGVVPDTVTVGQVFHAAIRVELPAGFRAGFPDTLDASGDIENAGRRELLEDTVGGARRVTAVYPLAAWRPGAQAVPPIPVRLVGPSVDSVLSVSLAPVTVASVLPRDTAGVKPKPAKGVVGGYGAPWLWLLLALLGLLLLAALIYYLIRRARRRPAVQPGPAPATARQRALDALDALGEAGVLEREGPIAFYSRATGIVRHYLHELHPPLGPDLTTLELSRLLRHSLPPEATTELLRLLDSADLVKFARRRPSAAEAEAERGALRAWVAAYPPAPAPARPEEVAA